MLVIALYHIDSPGGAATCVIDMLLSFSWSDKSAE